MRKRERTAFTLIELLVVIGIIVLIISITIPVVMRAFRAGDRARSAADLQTISVALENFKADFDDYPRPPANNAGFACLGRDLIGPYGSGASPTDPPAYSAGTFNCGDCVKDGSNAQYVCTVDGTTAAPSGAGVVPWVQVSGPPTAPSTTGYANDGADGPGLKKNGRGKTLGPYLQPDKFKVRGLAIIDRNGAPILYFVRSPGQRNTHVLNGDSSPSYVGGNLEAAYNSQDNEVFFRATGETTNQYSSIAIQVLMGDSTADGIVNGNDTEVSLPYVLWSAGPDGIFGPPRTNSANPATTGVWTSNMLLKYDDVTNFR